jgi:serine/threonine protein phosphatase 1
MLSLNRDKEAKGIVMNYFIVGDVHGCLHTFQKMLEHWDPDTQRLIQVGDLVDRGNFIVETVAYARELLSKYPDLVTFVLGNHEEEVLTLVMSGENEQWFGSMGGETITQYKKAKKPIREDAAWFANLPLYYEDDVVHVSHAGISAYAEDPYTRESLTWHRSEIKNIHKTQVYGHTPLFDFIPTYDPATRSYDIDTACVYGGKLTALVLDDKGIAIELIQLDVDPRDIKISISPKMVE